MIDWEALHSDAAASAPLQSWLSHQQAGGTCVLDASRYGDLPRWLAAVDQLPESAHRRVDLNRDAPRVALDLSDAQRTQLRDTLKALHPWRKGPFDIDDIPVDAEWRSDCKWRRIGQHLSSLEERLVLDVGCGNGYFCFRLLGAGAKLVIGLDPSALFAMQFAALKKLYGPLPAHLLPLPDCALETSPACYDTVLSMGVLYHRKSPFAHLQLLLGALRPGGELLLETLVTDGDQNHVLVPAGRYARMRNVWCLPSTAAVLHWLQRIGFVDAHCVDTTVTTVAEQRKTEWMRFESHESALDPNDPTQTIEGLPAPTRAAFVARRAH